MDLNKRLLAIAVAALLFPQAATAVKTIIYTDHEALGGMRTQFLNDVFFPAVERESQGRLKIEPHWDGKISTSYRALQTVSKGATADMAIVVPEYSAQELPLHQMFKSFPVGPSADKQIAFFRRVYREVPAFQAELLRQNVVPVFIATGYPVAFFSTHEIKKLDDLKETKWRTASFWHQDFLRNAGATPVIMPWGDGIYKALADGRLDGVMVNVDSGYQLEIHEAAPHVLLSPELWLGHVYLVVMNKQTWDRLTKAEQQAIRRAALSSYKKLGGIMRAKMVTQIRDMKKQGAQVRLVRHAEIMKWEKATRYQQVQASWVKEQQSKGLTEAGPVMARVSEIMKETMKAE
ncbi:TRAP transporter substrate-binding protein DctP [Dryocola clanedunensis]|uniref:TRAP transporter substrate-binding protein DctP n=1 Tax=Cedecea sulfonylureivorans TaxID=3051154 RepID=UPI00192797FC|nr:TRAP transporter substrate-binding protein DctP [Cedecea sulfonylureivorans]